MGLIGTALGAAAGIWGGIQASRAMKKAKAGIEKQRRKNEDWYNRRYNEDETQRASSQALLTKLREDIRNRNRQTTGAQAVMGGTQESVAAARAANNDALANAATNIVVNGERRKDAIENQYYQTDNQYQQQLSNLEMGKAQSIAEAAKGVAKAAGDMSFGTWNIGKKVDGNGNDVLDADGNQQPEWSIDL